MGYTTDFSGEFNCKPPLKPEHAAYLKQFSSTRRMKRDADKAALLPDPIRDAAGLPIGVDAANFVGRSGYAGEEPDDSIIDNNEPPGGQPGLWCLWTPNGNDRIEWDGGENFDEYVEWIKYLIDAYLKPWGYVLNGSVQWYGEDPSDLGEIQIDDNVVKELIGEIVYREEST
jgi:hypothetical protein